MKATSSALHAFVSRVSAAKRLNFGDLRRLQRDIIPDGPATRGDVAALIGLDAVLDRADDGWPAYLTASVTEFMVRSNGGAAETAWLASVLASAAPKTALGIARAVVSTLDEIDDTLRGLAKATSKRKPKAAACATGLTAAKIVGTAMSVEPRPLSFTWPDVRLGGPVLTVRLKS